MRILFVIRSLESGGGAERQLCQLADALAARGVAVAIAVMYDADVTHRFMSPGHGVELLDLGKQSRWDIIPFTRRCLKLAREFKPDLVHGYMSGANELALLIGRVLGKPVVWGIRVSDQDFSDYSLFRRTVFKIGCLLSGLPDLIIANSYKGRDFHVERGFPAARVIVVPNGIDVVRFRRDVESGVAWRLKHSIDPDIPLIVLPARFDPMKDHETFLRAVAEVEKSGLVLQYVAIGRGSPDEKRRVRAQIEAHGVSHRVRLLVDEANVESVYNAADIVTLTSAFGEGFPNVLGEAMACGRVCVSTDVGDAAVVIGDVGWIVPIRDPAQLARAWKELLALSPNARLELETQARLRIEEKFGIGILADSSLEQFASIARVPA